MNIPAVFFLMLYLIVFLIVLVFFIFNIYHVVRYALKSRVSLVITTIFIFGFLLIAGSSFVAIAEIDWVQNFNLLSF